MKNMKTVTVMYLSLILTLFVSCGSPFDGDESGNPWKPITNPQELTESVSLSRGANFSAWFEANAASYIPRLTTWYTERDFMHARSMGMDVIRLPIRMHSMAGGAPDYTLDPYLLKLLDEVVDWAEKYKLFIILDNHSAYTNEAMLISVWTQMAEHFK
ncbi:MAG: glycoside hydrolase family 5 protein, partial [Spirochaetaceae bacterium]|nr:glycoside hydrolase family 5 protein [Spirochaetaceae bacterium]